MPPTGPVPDRRGSQSLAGEQTGWALTDKGPAPAPLEPYVLGNLTIGQAERLVTLAGQPVRLKAKEYQLRYELSTNTGRVVTHDELLRKMWGSTDPRTCGRSGPT